MSSASDENREAKSGAKGAETCLSVIPGVCGFPGTVRAWRSDRREIRIQIEGSDCEQICTLARQVRKLSLRDIFKPPIHNPVFEQAARAGCHASCVWPVAVLKAAEVALEMALPRPVELAFVPCIPKSGEENGCTTT